VKKILYIVSTLSRSGPTNQLYNLVKYLNKEQFTPYLISLSPEPSNSRQDDFSALGVKMYNLELSRVKGIFFAKGKVKALIKSIEPDVIHTQGIRADVIASKIDCSTIKVCTIHNHPQQDYLMRYGNILGSLMLKKHLGALQHFNKCIGVSSAVEKNLSHLDGRIKTDSIINGVDTSLFSPESSIEKQNLRRKLSLPENAVIWIVSGHLSPLKDPLFLIKSWRNKFPSNNHNILLFIGNGCLYAKCQSLTQGASNIILKGRVNNVVEFLQASDYFISASHSEGLPMAVIEALACNLPVLLSDINPHLEILSMSENIGNSFRLGDFLSFSNSMDALLKENKSILNQSIESLVNLRLNAEIMSKKYQSIYLSHL